MDKVFKSRVRTCVVANLIYKDDDATVEFVVEERKIVREQNALKMNAVLNAYYVKIGKETPEYKNLKSKNKDFKLT